MKSIIAAFVGLKSSISRSSAKLFDAVNHHSRKVGLTLSILAVASSVFTGWYRGDDIRQWAQQKYKERVVEAAVNEFLNCMSEDPNMVVVGYQGFPSDGILLVVTFIAHKWPDGMTLDEYREHFFDTFVSSNNRLFTCLNEYPWQGVAITYVDIVVVETIDDRKVHAISSFRLQLIMDGDALKSIIPSDENSAPEQVDALIDSGKVDIITSTLFPVTVPAKMFNGDVDRAIEIYNANN